jgi:hypothetical protein
VQVTGAPFRRYPKQIINIHADFSPGNFSLSLLNMIARIVTFPKMTLVMALHRLGDSA